MGDNKGKVIVLSFLLAFIIILLAFVINRTMPSVNTGIVTTALTNLIQIDGVLFGFSAIMFGLVYSSGRIHLFEGWRKSFVFGLMFSSFWCYLYSLVAAFTDLLEQNATYVFSDVFVTVFGAVLSSVFLLLMLIEE